MIQFQVVKEPLPERQPKNPEIVSFRANIELPLVTLRLLQEYIDVADMSAYLNSTDLSGDAPDYRVRAGLDSPALLHANPRTDFYKELRVSFVSLDQQWVVLGGAVEANVKPGVTGCDFAFAARPGEASQEVDVLASQPGTMKFLEELVARSLESRRA